MADFFAGQTEASLLKAQIVSKYFKAWASVVMRHANKVAYIDLFAGKGRYADGQKSTPLMVLEIACKDDRLAKKLVAIFNDANPDYANSLDAEIHQLPQVSKLANRPIVHSFNVDEGVANRLNKVRMIPSLVFIDPWGYKGLSLALIASVIKDWGCDCLFFFNYNRVNSGIPNPVVQDNVDMLFGKERAAQIRVQSSGMVPSEREEYILNELTQALHDNGANYVLPFRFRKKEGGRTSHYLVFLSKHILGFEIMKSIMHGFSEKEDGVALFEYAAVRNPQLSFLFDLSPKPVDVLADELLKTLNGQSLSVAEVYSKCGEGTHYVKENIREALRRLEVKGYLACDKPANERPKRKGVVTMGDKRIVTFKDHPSDQDKDVI